MAEPNPIIRRGTTPIHVFTTDIDLSQATALYITYYQQYRTFEKTIEDCIITSDSVTVSLTQDETLLLSSDDIVEIQIRALFSDGRAVASNIMLADVGKIIKGDKI